MHESIKNLRFFKINCKLVSKHFDEQGIIACEIDKKLIETRLKNSNQVENYKVDEIKFDEVIFPVTLIGVNNKYYSWDDLAKDFMVAKLSGVI